MTDDQSTGRRTSGGDALDRQAEVAAFTLFALQSRSIELTIERAGRLARGALGAVSGRVVRSGDPESAGAVGDADQPVALSVPVRVEGRHWGRLEVGDRPSRKFSSADADFLAALAAVLGAAVARDQADRGRAVLAQVGEKALRTGDAHRVVAEAVEGLRSALEASAAAVVHVVPKTPPALVVMYADGLTGIPAGHRYAVSPALLRALAGRTPLVVEDWAEDGRFTGPLLPGEPASGWRLAVPVVLAGQTWGWLVASGPVPKPITVGQVELAAGLAELIATVLDRQSPLGSGEAGGPAAVEVALLDVHGVIVWVNDAWRDFCAQNGGDPLRSGIGMSYLEQCEAAPGDPAARDVAAAILAAVTGDLPAPMSVRIPCPDDKEDRWFDVLVSSRYADDGGFLGATVTLTRVQPWTFQS